MARYVYRLQVPHTGEKRLRIVLRFNLLHAGAQPVAGNDTEARPQIEYRGPTRSYKVDSSNQKNLPGLRVVDRGTFYTEEYDNAESLLA